MNVKEFFKKYCYYIVAFTIVLKTVLFNKRNRTNNTREQLGNIQDDSRRLEETNRITKTILRKVRESLYMWWLGHRCRYGTYNKENTKMMLYSGVQDDILKMGEGACGFLSVCRFFNLNLEDLPKAVAMAQNNKSIADDFFVNDWKLLLETIDPRNRKWSAKKSEKYDENCTFALARFYNPDTRKQHFVWCDNKGVIYDSIKNSVTVSKGYIADYRLFYVVK